jgi:hypothetical protein
MRRQVTSTTQGHAALIAAVSFLLGRGLLDIPLAILASSPIFVAFQCDVEGVLLQSIMNTVRKLMSVLGM